MSDLPLIYVHSLPGLIGPGSLVGGVAVVLDVLRATTVMVHALGAGATAVIPCLEIEDARGVAGRFAPGLALLAGERQGLPIEGFDFGNSPGDFVPGVCDGKSIVMTTTNGTRAILASIDAEQVYLGSFLNLTATLRTLRADRRPIHVVCSGTNGLISFEDNLLAGAIVHGLIGEYRHAGNDEALLAEMAWKDASGEPLVEILSRGTGGRRVREIGPSADIAVAAEVDRVPIVAEVVRNPIRVIRVEAQR